MSCVQLRCYALLQQPCFAPDMPRSAVKVILRTRPSDSFPKAQIVLDQSTKTVSISTGSRSSGLPSEKIGPPVSYQFKFEGILHNASQEDVFQVCGTEAVQAAMDGYNGTVMCYGQTGAGKTFTMTGDRRSYKQRGLIPRTVAATLAALQACPGVSSWSLAVSYLEIYNESLYDLLDINTQPHELSIYEDASSQMQVSGLRKVNVSSEAEALALFFEGETNRVIGQHQLNRESSRSHSVFSLHLTVIREGAEGSTMVSKLSLVDLAGSERVSKTRSEGLVLKEAGHINKSLHILEQVVLAASERGRDHVPYRSSKLTWVLKDSLGGNCKTILIANVWGEAAQIDETLGTCRFAARMARLVCEVRSNVMQERGATVKALEREVQELKEELAMMQLMTRLQQQQQSDSSSQSGSSGSSNAYHPYSGAQRQRLRATVVSWLQQPDEQQELVGSGGSNLAPLPLTSVRQLRELLFAFKAVVKETLQNSNSSPSARHQQVHSVSHSAERPSAAAVAGVSSYAGNGAVDSTWHEGVGEAKEDHIHMAAAAPDNARPAAYGQEQQRTQQNAGDSSDDAAGPGPLSAMLNQPHSQHAAVHRHQTGLHGAANGVAAVVPDKAAALELYRSGSGAERAQVLNDNHGRLRTAKRRAKELALALNGLKYELDNLKNRQEEIKQQRQAAKQQPAEALNPEEYQLVISIRDIKAQYRDTHAELQLVRDEVQYTSGLLDTCKAELLEDFDAWYTNKIEAAAATARDKLSDLHSRAESSSTANWSKSLGAAAHSPGSRQPAVGSIEAVGGSARSSPHQRQSTPPLASLVGSLEDASDPEAAAYYAAQNAAWRPSVTGPKPGASRKHRGERGTFSLSERSSIMDKPTNRLM